LLFVEAYPILLQLYNAPSGVEGYFLSCMRIMSCTLEWETAGVWAILPNGGLRALLVRHWASLPNAPALRTPDMQDSITRTWELTCEEMLRALADIDEMTRKLRRELL